MEQYDAFSPLPGMNVNGELTLGENIGDLAGLAVAYKAYQLALDGKPAPVLDGFTGDQRFFIGWGQVWARKYREDELRQAARRPIRTARANTARTESSATCLHSSQRST